MTKLNYNIVEERTRLVSLAVKLVDDFTGENPVGNISVSLVDTEGKKYNPVKNPSGYFVFVDLPSEVFTLQIEGDGYFYDNTAFEKIDLTNPDPAKILKTPPPLKPKPDYTFPPGTTLIRGLVKKEGSQKPVENATVEIVGETTSKETVLTQTDNKGEFVLYFRTLKGEDVETSGQTRYIIIGMNRTLTLKVQKGAASNTATVSNVIEGTVTSVNQAIELNISS